MGKMDIKRSSWLKKRKRTKKTLGTLGVLPRLVVFKSNKHIYAQLVDDISSKTIVSSSTKDKDMLSVLKKVKGKINQSIEVGKILSDKIKKSKIEKIVFDRNGYRYHGRVKALADTIRDNGIKI